MVMGQRKDVGPTVTKPTKVGKVRPRRTEDEEVDRANLSPMEEGSDRQGSIMGPVTQPISGQQKGRDTITDLKNNFPTLMSIRNSQDYTKKESSPQSSIDKTLRSSGGVGCNESSRGRQWDHQTEDGECMDLTEGGGSATVDLQLQAQSEPVAGAANVATTSRDMPCPVRAITTRTHTLADGGPYKGQYRWSRSPPGKNRVCSLHNRTPSDV